MVFCSSALPTLKFHAVVKEATTQTSIIRSVVEDILESKVDSTICNAKVDETQQPVGTTSSNTTDEPSPEEPMCEHSSAARDIEAAIGRSYTVTLDDADDSQQEQVSEKQSPCVHCVRVVGVDHHEDNYGKVFFFQPEELNEMLGTASSRPWLGKTYSVVQRRDGDELWRGLIQVNRAGASSFGKRNVDDDYQQWEVNDVLVLEDALSSMVCDAEADVRNAATRAEDHFDRTQERVEVLLGASAPSAHACESGVHHNGHIHVLGEPDATDDCYHQETTVLDNVQGGADIVQGTIQCPDLVSTGNVAGERNETDCSSALPSVASLWQPRESELARIAASADGSVFYQAVATGKLHLHNEAETPVVTIAVLETHPVADVVLEEEPEAECSLTLARVRSQSLPDIPSMKLRPAKSANSQPEGELKALLALRRADTTHQNHPELQKTETSEPAPPVEVQAKQDPAKGLPKDRNDACLAPRSASFRSLAKTEKRFDFGAGLSRCGVCESRMPRLNRGCDTCKIRMCRACFGQHDCGLQSVHEVDEEQLRSTPGVAV